MQRTWSEIVAADPGHSRRYAERWANFAAQGRDIDGEARLIDAMAPRGARILDAGCGQGRLGGYLAARGHEVVGVDIDPYLISVARDVQPGGTWLVGDLAQLGDALATGDTDATEAADQADDGTDAPNTARTDAPNTARTDAKTGDFDVIVAAGNVLTFIDPADRGDVLIGFRDALATGGRAVMGFGAGRGWSHDEFESDAFEAGLRITHRFSTWNLLPFSDHANFIVAIAERA
ncbi:bifunctional 2-polyprenyl-6-hydroxyphenol methylase/3-demethylubiquinol 3-O-methyltransferase UbiG [uncultured Corynebacterium sp.]|uniref:class I SAM-dependent methyltransferase n=1 Tax=uncultured Corynebacterium sp. TaxID=159447 RepID=UPI0025EC53F6|nr:class I SAM-dependent methyltransferase [uncultured Corynebacterium sp.]